MSAGMGRKPYTDAQVQAWARAIAGGIESSGFRDRFGLTPTDARNVARARNVELPAFDRSTGSAPRAKAPGPRMPLGMPERRTRHG